MCECGCVENDVHYRFPGPGETFYILTLSGGCIDCDAPSGVVIRHIKPGESNYEWFSDKETIDGELPFDMWGDGSAGAAVATGMLRSEFIKATKQHLIGINSKDFDDNNEDRKIGEIAAEVILEEMYQDAQTRPRLVVQVEENKT